MNMTQLYNDVSFKISKLVTQSYSTSFSIAVSFLDAEMRKAIYGIYGFVRLADEIVDTFHDHDKKALLQKFENDYYEALNNGLSLNPVLHSFQQVVNTYKIPDELIQAFLNSMKADLYKHEYNNKASIDEYIYGSAEAVGLMCLKVFVRGNASHYDELRHPAMRLGAAFQKVNFLRDLRSDMEFLGRSYFPEITFKTLDEVVKKQLIHDIKADFSDAYPGIRKLPRAAKLPVLIAYSYYLCLLQKIKKTPAEKLMMTRIRISDFKKFILLMKAYLNYKLKLI
jgi:phytoene synthase